MSSDWNIARQYVVNGSTAYRIFKAQLRKAKSLEDFKTTMWNYWKGVVPEVSAIEHGKKTEDKAIKKFMSKPENQNYTVVPAGKFNNDLFLWHTHLVFFKFEKNMIFISIYHKDQNPKLSFHHSSTPKYRLVPIHGGQLHII